MIINEQRSGVERRSHTRKNQFVATISHELRTPMHALLVAIDLLGETQLTKQQAHHVGVSKEAGEYFLSLLNELLDHSQLEYGEIQLSAAPFHLPNLAASVLDLMRVQAKDKDIVFRCSVDPALRPWRRGDARRVKQILVNLVNNAIKFTIAGEINIKMTCMRADRVLIEVMDTGLGIPELQQKRIFDSFVQAPVADSQGLRGVGLGLTICKQLAKIMAGDIYVRSQLGVGSTFGCDLLLPAVSEPCSEVSCAADVQDINRVDFARLSVLVADDSALNCRVMEDLLCQLGCRVICVNNGHEAIKRLCREHYDLVLMDMRMPVMNGLRSTRIIRYLEKHFQSSKRWLNELPIIALSASADPAEMNAAREAGCNDYLVKPLRKADFTQVLLKLFADRK